MRPEIASAVVLLAALAAAPASAQPASLEAGSIPPRSADAASGSEFARRTAGLSGRERQRQAVAELTGGNLPRFLRQLRPVRLTLGGAPGGIEGVVWVTPDYLAVGSESDFLRFPLTYPSAVAVAQRFGMLLPTRKMVDAIYEQAAHRLAPQPMPPGPAMRSTAYYLRHQETIERQLAGRPRGDLVAGHKKDVVITRRLLSRRGRIAIYGWHRAKGRPIQPLSLVHGARYADYSHGVRLVHPTVWIDGEPRPILEVLEDRALGPLLSYEGTLPGARRLLDAAAVAAESP